MLIQCALIESNDFEIDVLKNRAEHKKHNKLRITNFNLLFAIYFFKLRLLTFHSLAVSLRAVSFNIQIFYMVLALRSVFCTDLRTDSDLCCMHH